MSAQAHYFKIGVFTLSGITLAVLASLSSVLERCLKRKL